MRHRNAGSAVRLWVVPAVVVVVVWTLAPVAHASGPKCFGKTATIVSNAKKITGTPGSDVIVAGDRGSTIDGNGGNDLICAGAGNDTIVHRPGNEKIDGGSGSDWVDYEHAAGPVVANLATGVATGDGTDQLVSIENIEGSNFSDTLTGTSGSNYLAGEGGDDILSGGGGFDFVEGDAGNDTLSGGGGTDFAVYMFAPSAVDVNLAAGTATGGDGSDTLSGFEGVIGSDFNDTLTALSSGFSFLVGGACFNNDFTLCADGNDTFNGNGGTAFVMYLFSPGPVAADLATSVANGDGADTLNGIHGLYGSSYFDTFDGSSGNDYLFGGLGPDTLHGAGGSDVLVGGTGSNVIDGGTGHDYCIQGPRFANCESYTSKPTPVSTVLNGFRKGFRK